MKAWKEFENITEIIQAELSPDAVITRNEKIKGKSGAINECDVVIRASIGQLDFFGIIECKDHKDKIGIPFVREFITKVDDVGAMKGIIVAKNGFTSEAITLSKDKNIDTYTLFDAKEINWRKYAFIPVVVILVSLKSANVKIFNQIAGEQIKLLCSDGRVLPNNEIILFSEKDHSTISLTDYIKQIWDNLFKFDSTLTSSNLSQTFQSKENSISILLSEKEKLKVRIVSRLECYYTYYFSEIPLSEGKGFNDKIQNKIYSAYYQTEQFDVAKAIASWNKTEKKEEIPFKPVLWLRIIYHFKKLPGPYLSSKLSLSKEKNKLIINKVIDSGEVIKVPFDEPKEHPR
ncbi:MAG: restriction endonuclease [Candidatus Delongbacteria bacterium]|nr:restriction endonuclease [Candidatus Delongbacteria bacterium]